MAIHDIGVSLALGFVEHHVGESVCIVATGYMTHVAMRVVDKFALESVGIGLIDLFDL